LIGVVDALNHDENGFLIQSEDGRVSQLVRVPRNLREMISKSERHVGVGEVDPVPDA
jgi:hypothetical protein